MNLKVTDNKNNSCNDLFFFFFLALILLAKIILHSKKSAVHFLAFINNEQNFMEKKCITDITLN